MLGGITLFSSAKMDLRSEVIPEAPSEWPKFGQGISARVSASTERFG